MAEQNDELLAYATDLHQEVLQDADVPGAEQLRPDVFTRLIVERIIDAGEAEELHPCYLKLRGIEVSAYGIDDGDTVNLVATLYRGDLPPTSLTQTDVNTATGRLLGFWDRCRRGPFHEDLEESSDASDMALAVHNIAKRARRLRLFIATDGVSRLERSAEGDHEGLPYSRTIWDLGYMQRLDSSGVQREPIVVDFVDNFGGPLPCLNAPQGTEGYEAMLVVFPGRVLADIYEEFGARLLELNVRSYLQATGKVNKGIRETLREQPGRFLAYNNGISATASKVDLVKLLTGETAIARIHDLQIVNGGQTTASVHRAQYRDKADLSLAGVQAKLTVVEPALLEDVVPLISRFANSQNKVSEADLSSNDPFQISFEELSRTIWTPSVGVGARQTRWFYERARGQYRDAESRAGTTLGKRRSWRETHPTKQKFTKTDLAKVWNAWDQLPHEVSKGAQKNFTTFANSKSKPDSPDATFFELIVAKAILWKESEVLIRRQDFGGYRANLVAYSIAKLSNVTGQRLDLHTVWLEQGLRPEIETAIVDLARVAWDVLTNPEKQGTNVTEWAKQAACWKAMKNQPWRLPDDLQPLLLASAHSVGQTSEDRTTEVDPNVVECQAMGGDGWLELSTWAKETGNLEPWQRSLAFDIGKRMKRGAVPSKKQALYGAEILNASIERGFSVTVPSSG